MSNVEIAFQRDIRPLFRDEDREAMESWFDLFSYDEVRDQAPMILERLEDGSMPCDAPWPAEQVALFQRWVEEGCLE